MEGEVVQLQTIYEFVRTGIDAQGAVHGELRATGIRPKFLEHLRLAGFDFGIDMFDPAKVL
jgi:pilus assembly protein CpaF